MPGWHESWPVHKKQSMMNIMKKKILYVTILLLSWGYVSGQAFSEIKDVDLINEKTILMERDFPSHFDTIAIMDIVPIDNDHSKIIYYDSDIKCEAIVNTDRKDMFLVATAVEIPRDEVPDFIFNAMQDTDYAAWKVENTYVMKTPYENWFYAIDVTTNEKQERIFFNRSGGLKKRPY